MSSMNREIKVEFTPDRNDPYELDYKLSIGPAHMTTIVRLSSNEFQNLIHQIELLGFKVVTLL
jgi:hypothetical protein